MLYLLDDKINQRRMINEDWVNEQMQINIKRFIDTYINTVEDTEQ